jgi:hypothetical protein
MVGIRNFSTTAVWNRICPVSYSSFRSLKFFHPCRENAPPNFYITLLGIYINCCLLYSFRLWSQSKTTTKENNFFHIFSSDPFLFPLFSHLFILLSYPRIHFYPHFSVLSTFPFLSAPYSHLHSKRAALSTDFNFPFFVHTVHIRQQPLVRGTYFIITLCATMDTCNSPMCENLLTINAISQSLWIDSLWVSVNYVTRM